MRTLFLALVVTGSALAAEVIDLGKLEVQGKTRGPEVKVVDAGQLNPAAPAQWLRAKLEKLEAELLVSESAPEAFEGGGTP